jgi:hypothetical protein
MTYIITTFDDKQHQVDNEFGTDLIEAWMNSDKSFPVDLGHEAINSSTIKSINPMRVTEAELPRPIRETHYPKLSSGKTCTAQKSIQHKLNNIAQTEGGKDWAKLIKDTKWREKTRLKLWESSEDWCDYRVGTCACE